MITTAIPPTINKMYKGRRFLTKDGKAAKHTLGMEILSQRTTQPLTGSVTLNVIFYFGNKHKNDIDNRLKALLDCCTGILYEDDSQITELHVYKEFDKENPRTEITIL